MNKIPTIFLRDLTKRPSLVMPMWNPSCTWVTLGEGIATRKYDGTACMIRDGKLYKRRELSASLPLPPGFLLCESNPLTNKAFGWVPVGIGPDDRWHREALMDSIVWPDGTYELLGPKVQGNWDRRSQHVLQAHNMAHTYPEAPREFEPLKAWLAATPIEGLVWHHPDGRMAKIKRRDFGFPWPCPAEP